MWSEHDFFLSVDPKTIMMGEDFLLSASAVPLLLEQCETENILILGFDAFKITPEGHRHPQMEHIYATSLNQNCDPRDAIQAAISEIRTYFQKHFPEGTELHFAFVLEPH